jgi:kumamolisin
VKQHYGKKLLLFWQAAAGLVIIGLLVSACSFPGSSPGSATTTIATKIITPTPTSTHPRTVANQPPTTGELPGGQPLPENAIKSLTFNLAYNDSAYEHDFVQIYTPGSPSYHQFLTPDQIVQRYALSDSQLKVVQDWLTQHGYTIISTDSLRSGIKVQATVASIEHSLNIQLSSFSILGHQFFMQQGVPTLTGQVASLVQSVVGLNNFAFPTFKPPFSFTSSISASGANCSKYGAKQTLTRDKLAAAYQINQLYKQGFQGRGMTIGVAEFGDSYDPKDIANYAACAGINPPNIQNIDVNGHLPAGPGQGEAALDLELIAGLAPQAQILDYQASLNNTSFAQALVDVFNRVATDHKVQVLSVSYGAGEDTFSTSEQDAVNRSLRNLAAEGVSVFVSSGDCGAYSYRVPHVAMVSFPASAPYAIAVGGTHLQLNNNNVRTSEDVWSSNDGAPVCQNEWGSGGGVSQNSDFKRSSWQLGPGTSNHYDGASSLVLTFNAQPVSAPNGLRQVPDVAADAYPNISIYYQGNWYRVGGTSAAAPIWAAGALLVDQGLQHQGKTSLGGVPALYTLANHPGNLHPYTDITSGNNLFYPATRGWDYASGWGSPNFNDILLLEAGQ